MKELDRLIRFYEGADYYGHDEPETRYAWRGTAFWIIAISSTIAIGVCAAWVWAG